MIRILILLLLYISASTLPAQVNEPDKLPIKETLPECKERILNDSTWFPDAKEDFQPVSYQAKAAFPTSRGSSRIWVKGSKEYNKVRLRSAAGNIITETRALEAPFYVAVLDVNDPSEYITAEFINSTTATTTTTGPVELIRNEIYIPEPGSFSIMFYGCFQPFYVDTNQTPQILTSEDDPLNRKMRQLLRMVAYQDTISYTAYDQEQEETGEGRAALSSEPVAIIGTGDQIYTDAGYAEDELKGHPLSAWAHTCNNPYPLLDIDAYIEHLHKCYLNFYGFTPLAQTLQKLPSFNVWDDHEVRDGWGSHGDEYISPGVMNDTLAPFYMASRDAFIQHQWIQGPVREIPKEENTSLHAAFRIKGVPVFTFDLRSNRNIKDDVVISEEQMLAFKEWCSELENDQEVVIVSSIPIFSQPAGEKIAVSTNSEMLDDVHDSWKYSKTQRDTIIKYVIGIRERNIRPIIIAGDVHFGSVTEVWYEMHDERKILSYEVITSGLNHETMGGGITTSLKDKRKGTDWDDKETRINIGAEEVQYYPSIRYSKVNLNFSTLEFNSVGNSYINVFIVGDNKGTFHQRRLEVDWEKTYRQEKRERTRSISQFFRGSYTPPKIPYRSFVVE